MKFNKKLISIIILSVMLLSLLCVGSFADKDITTLSEDLKTVVHNGQEFIYVPNEDDSLVFNFDYTDWDNIEFSLSKQQSDAINYYYTTEYYNQNDALCALELEIYFTSNAVYLAYIRSDYYDDYQALIEGNANDVIIDAFSQYTYSEAEISCQAAKLKSGTASTMQSYMLYAWKPMYVYSFNGSGEILMESGVVFHNDSNDVFYYLDYKENGIESLLFIDKPNNISLKVYEIIDAELVAELDEIYNSEDYFDEEFFDFEIIAVVTLIISTIVIGGGSLALAIIFFIKSAKAQRPYNILYRAIAITGSVTVALVIILVVVLML